MPLALSAKTPADTSGVELTWNGTPNAVIVGYYIYYGTASGTYGWSQYCGDAMILRTVTPVGGRYYYFVIAPMDAYGNVGQYSLLGCSSIRAGADRNPRCAGNNGSTGGGGYFLTASPDSDVSGYAVYYGLQSGNYQNAMCTSMAWATVSSRG